MDAPSTTYTIAGLTPNKDYTFKVRARNIYGYGPFSTSVVIKTTDKPYVMDPVITSTALSGLEVILQWSPP